ncbi:MAG: LytR C-terminal domain-containing protein [Actinobacteria bacterium]|nr:LytR C-terminal domain-containing protein [Actinomycetota bacterium]
MDHPITLTRDDPWRTTAIVASGFAALELLFILVVGLALLAKPFTGGDERPNAAAAVKEATAAPAPAAKSPPAAQPAATKPRNETSVMVLNGNGSSGAASEKADLVQTKGYLIAGTANAPHTDFARSVVMYRPGHRPEAERLSKDFQIGRVAPLDGLRPADLQGAHVALIVGES